jgi:putative redox protein
MMTRTARARSPEAAVNDADLRELHEQKKRAFDRHPSLGKTSAQAKVCLRGGFACEVRRPGGVTRVDLPFEEGGTASAPAPGDLMRASIGACLAMGYRAWAARFGVELRSVEVDVTCEFDVRGQLGVASDVPVGWERLLLEVRIVSDAPPSALRRVVEHADRLSPMLANLSPAVRRIQTLTLEPSTPTFDTSSPSNPSKESP